ncbi:MAG TPA: DUF2332 family protein [Symbiobacteriaceae bacterium]|nr:DUF2332 family protein [Symbiobacteriaceae bacterium]
MSGPLQSLIRQSFGEGARRWAGRSPRFAALCAGLAESRALLALIQTYARVTAVQVPPVDSVLAGLHRVALAGDAPDLATQFQSSHLDEAALIAAAEGALEAQSTDLLDALLTPPPPPADPADGVALAAATRLLAERWGGGFSLVELGGGSGLPLRFDQWTYADLAGPFPPIVGRYGLSDNTLDLSSPGDLLWAAAQLAPEEREAAARLQAAAAALPGLPTISQRRGDPAYDLLPLLLEAYAAMEPGNTLLLFSLWHWQTMTGAEQQAATHALQRLAGRLEPQKFLAFLQLDHFTPEGAPAELRLQTFHWRDPEERSVERLATYANRRVGWLS